MFLGRLCICVKAHLSSSARRELEADSGPLKSAFLLVHAEIHCVQRTHTNSRRESLALASLAVRAKQRFTSLEECSVALCMREKRKISVKVIGSRSKVTDAQTNGPARSAEGSKVARGRLHTHTQTNGFAHTTQLAESLQGLCHTRAERERQAERETARKRDRKKERGRERELVQ